VEAVKRARTAKSDRKKNAILDAAAAVIAQRGFAETSLSEVAEKAGTQAGSIYYHFDSRETLIEEVLLRGVKMTYAATKAAIAELPAEASAWARFEVGLRTHLTMNLADSAYARASIRLVGQVPAEMWIRVRKHYEEYGRFLDKLLRQAAADGDISDTVDPSVLRLLLFGAANWAPEWFRPNGRLGIENVAQLLVQLARGAVNDKSREAKRSK
jgi:AcrR family transcriptional regulator